VPANLRTLAGLELDFNRFTSFNLASNLTRLASLDLSFNQLTNLTLPPGLTNLNFLGLDQNQLANLSLPGGLTNLASLHLDGNGLTSLTLPPDLTHLTALFLGGNPLATLVLSEPMAATSLAGALPALREQGVSVFTFPLEVRLIRLQQPIGVFQFAISGPPGVYSVLASPDLAEWSELRTVTNALGKSVFTDETAHLSPQKFYRARSL